MKWRQRVECWVFGHRWGYWHQQIEGDTWIAAKRHCHHCDKVESRGEWDGAK